MATNDLDKIKRRLIRNVAKLKSEKLPDDAIWTTLKQTQTFDCKALWERMQALTSKKLVRLFLAEDCTQKVTPVARMTNTDWLMFDLVLVHEPVEVMVMYNDKIPKVLERLISLVFKYQIESRPPEDLVKAWLRLTLDYNVNGRHCSPMLLQRRWYLLKQVTRKTFYALWFEHRSALQKATELPSHIMTYLASRYPGLLTSPFMEWEEMVEKKYIALPADLNNEFNKKKSKSITTEPDLIVMEPTIETIDLIDKEKGDEQNSECVQNNTNTNVVPQNVSKDQSDNVIIPEGAILSDDKEIYQSNTIIDDKLKVKLEETENTCLDITDCEVHNIEDESDMGINENIPEENVLSYNKGDDQGTFQSEVSDDTCLDIISRDVYNVEKSCDTETLQCCENSNDNTDKTGSIAESSDGIVHVDSQTELENKIKSGAIDIVPIKKEINEKYDGLLNVKIIATSHISDLSARKFTNESDMIINTNPEIIETNKQLDNAISLSIDDAFSSNNIIKSGNLAINNYKKHVVEPQSIDTCNSFISEQGIIIKNQDISLDDRESHLHLKFLTCNSHDTMEIKNTTETSTDKVCYPQSMIEKKGIDNVYSDNILNDELTNQPSGKIGVDHKEKEVVIDMSDDDLSDLEFVDEGIEFHEDDLEPNTQQSLNLENVTENNTYTCEKEVDEKLIMLPKVYTKKLENMNVLKKYKYNETINVCNIIDHIIIESKPKYIQSKNTIDKKTEQVFDKPKKLLCSYVADKEADCIKYVKIDVMNKNSEKVLDYCSDNIINSLKTISDEETIVASKNTNKLFDINYADEVDRIIKIEVDTKDALDNNTLGVDPNISLNIKDDFNIDVKKDNQNDNIDLGVNINNELMYNMTYDTIDIVRFDVSSDFLQKPINCKYNPIMLCKNPDFNTRLKRLPIGFISIPNNYLMLKACKPLTIDLHRTFESKLTNGVLYLKNNNTDIKKIKKSTHLKPNFTTASVMPSALPAQSLVDNVKVNINDFVPPQSNDTDYEFKCTQNKQYFEQCVIETKLHTNPVGLCETSNNFGINNSKTKDNDIDYELKSTENKKYFEQSVLETKLHTYPVGLCETSNNFGINNSKTKETEIKNDNNFVQGPEVVRKSTNNINTGTQNVPQKTDASKQKKTFRNRVNIPWFTRNPITVQHLNDSCLLALDSVDKMLNHLRNIYNNNQSLFIPYPKQIIPHHANPEKAKTVTIIDELLDDNITIDNLPKDTNNDKSIKKKKNSETKSEEIESFADPSLNPHKPKIRVLHQNTNTLKEKKEESEQPQKRKRLRKYCCWVKRYVIHRVLYSYTSRIKLVSHTCPYNDCQCCCKDFDRSHMCELIEEFINNQAKDKPIDKLNFNLVSFTKKKSCSSECDNIPLNENSETALQNKSSNKESIELSDDEDKKKTKVLDIANETEKDKPIRKRQPKKSMLFIEKNKVDVLEELHQNQPKILTENPNFILPDGVHLILLPNGKVHAVVEPGIPKLSDDVMQTILDNTLRIQNQIKNNKEMLISYPDNIQNQTLENIITQINNAENHKHLSVNSVNDILKLSDDKNINNPYIFTTNKTKNNRPIIGCEKGKICINAKGFSPIINNDNAKKNAHLFVIRPHKSKYKPIFLGNNKILLTTTNLHMHEMMEQGDRAPVLLEKMSQGNTGIPKFDLPNGVNLMILPNGIVNPVIEPGISFSDDIMNKIQEHAAMIQHEIKNNFDQLTKTNNDTGEVQNQTLENIINQINNLENEILNSDHSKINTNDKEITEGSINEINSKLDVIENTNFNKDNDKITCHKINDKDNSEMNLDTPKINLLPNRELDPCIESIASTQCRNTNNESLEAQSNSSDIANVNVKINDHNNQINSFVDIETNAKKSILSDLMEMSGISEDDVITDNLTDNIQLNTEGTNKEIKVNSNIGETKNILELSPISSIDELRFATQSNGKFYSLNLNTGQVFSVKIEIKKNSNGTTTAKKKTKTSSKQSSKISVEDVIEIDDSDDSDCIVNDSKGTSKLSFTSSPGKDKNTQNLKRKLKTSKNISILRNNNRKTYSNINAHISQSQKDVDKKHKLSSNFSSQIESFKSLSFDDDSDDEPLIKVKRKDLDDEPLIKIKERKSMQYIEKEKEPDQMEETVQYLEEESDLNEMEESVQYLDEDSDIDQEKIIQTVNEVCNRGNVKETIVSNSKETNPDQIKKSIQCLDKENNSDQIEETLQQSDDESISQDVPMECEEGEDSEAILGL